MSVRYNVCQETPKAPAHSTLSNAAAIHQLCGVTCDMLNTFILCLPEMCGCACIDVKQHP